ncbi:MAG TPA: DUF4192 domain-containing protein [Jatrophihabitans sp.]|nr:DUF4192 domain-containing protein [Jatrophihabitans sp.]
MELAQGIPYLLGFHPRESLVLVGTDSGRVVVTARLDIADAAAALSHTLQAMARGGATEVIAAIYADESHGCEARPAGALPMTELADDVATAAACCGCDLLDVLLVAGRRLWSYTCKSATCCPPEGWVLDDSASPFAAAATYAGIVALPDRDSLAAQLQPLPDERRAALLEPIEAAEDARMDAVLDGRGDKQHRSVKRAVFAAARAASAPRWAPPTDAEAARYGAALAEHRMFEAVWAAIDAGRLDGRELWRDLARRLPTPYDAPPLFLFAWNVWRKGDGTLAGMAAERALASDSEFSPADLLLAALSHGVSPHRLPRVRRSA